MTAVVQADDLVRPVWRRGRFWAALVVVVILGAVLVAALGTSAGQPLDPASAHKNGSKALSRLLDRYGVTVHSVARVDDALNQARGAAVVITAPDAYNTAQLHRLAVTSARLILVAPSGPAAGVVDAGPRFGHAPRSVPDCVDPGAKAAGPLDWPADASTYALTTRAAGVTSCYSGAYLIGRGWAVLGSAALLRNDHLAEPGVAALDINAMTDSRRLTQVVWLLPGADAGTSAAPATVWQLFPPGAYRVFWWTVGVGVLVLLWRGRRLGAAVREPLPVVVRAAELVEGHGRLYARAGAYAESAAALRRAATARITRRLGLPRGADALHVGTAVAAALGRPPAAVVAVLAGPPAGSEADLLALARDLDELESALESAQRASRSNTSVAAQPAGIAPRVNQSATERTVG